MADMVPVTITGVVRGTEDGSERRERFFIELAAAPDGDARRLLIGVGALSPAFQQNIVTLYNASFPASSTRERLAAKT